MAALLRFELRKLLQNKALWICFGVCAFLLIINGITNLALAKIIKEAAEEMGQPYESSDSALTMLKTVFSSNTSTICVVVVSLIACEDFMGDVIKNIYSKGYSRTQVYFAKLISSLIGYMIILIGGMIVSFFTGLALFMKVGTMGQNYIPSLLCIILVALAYFAIYFSLAMIFKKVAPTIILGILGPTGVFLLLAMGDAFIKNEDISLTDYWLTMLQTNLALPDVENKTIITSIVLSIILIAGFGCLSFFLNRRKDAK